MSIIKRIWSSLKVGGGLFIFSSVFIKMIIGSENWLHYSICWIISGVIVHNILGGYALFSKEEIDSGFRTFMAMIIGIIAFFIAVFITGVLIDNPLALNLGINSGISAFIMVYINDFIYTQNNEE